MKAAGEECDDGNVVNADECLNTCLLPIDREGSFVIDSQDTSGDLSSIATCASISGNLSIQGTSLTTLDGLSALTFIGGSLSISDNHSLRSLNGLNALSAATSLSIHNNDALTNLQGLNALEAVGESLDIRSNDALPTCEAQWLRDNIGLSNIAGEITIGQNGSGTCD